MPKDNNGLEVGDYIYIWKDGDPKKEIKRKIIKEKTVSVYWVKGGGPYYEDVDHDDELLCWKGECVTDKGKS